jgi:hypothetical protein
MCWLRSLSFFLPLQKKQKKDEMMKCSKLTARIVFAIWSSAGVWIGEG